MLTVSEYKADLRKRRPDASEASINKTAMNKLSNGDIIPDPVKETIPSKRTEPTFDFKKEGRIKKDNVIEQTLSKYLLPSYDPNLTEEPSDMMKTLFPATAAGGGYVVNPTIDLLTMIDRLGGKVSSLGKNKISDPTTYINKPIATSLINALPIDPNGIIAGNIETGAQMLSPGIITKPITLLKSGATAIGKKMLRSDLNIGTNEAENLAKLFDKKTAKEGRKAAVDFITEEQLYTPMGLSSMVEKASQGAKKAIRKKDLIIDEASAKSILSKELGKTSKLTGMDLFQQSFNQQPKKLNFINIDETFENLKDLIKTGQIKNVAPEDINRVVSELDRLQLVYKDPLKTGLNKQVLEGEALSTLVDLPQAEQLRETIERGMYKTPSLFEHPVKAKAKELAGRALSEKIVQAAPNVAPTNLEIRKMKALEEVLSDAVEKAEKKPFLSLTDWIAGGIGTGLGAKIAPLVASATTSVPLIVGSAAGVPIAMGAKKLAGNGRGAGVLLQADKLSPIIQDVPMYNKYVAGLQTLSTAAREKQKQDARRRALQKAKSDTLGGK